MACTVAQHMQRPRGGSRGGVVRTIHLGILVVPGTPMAGVQRHARRPPVGAPGLESAARAIRRDLHQVYAPFELDDAGWRVSYRWVFDVKCTTSSVPVHSDVIYEAAAGAVAEGRVRTAGSALIEGRLRGLENIAIVVDLVRGAPHGPCFDEQGRSRSVSELRFHAGIQDMCSNAMVVGVDEGDFTGTLTPAHEVGHMLGLSNARDASSIMGPQSPGRRLMGRDRTLLHHAIQLNIPGMRRPERMQTVGIQAPYEFPGALPATR